jgi:hypothetical protein
VPSEFLRISHGFFLLRFYIKFILQNCIFRLVAPSGILEQDSGSWRPGFRIRLPLGCHRGFRTLRAAGLRAHSGATMFFSLRERMDRSSARVPQWFPHLESGWITRPLGCHRVFLNTRTHGSLVRSGATVVSAPGERLDYAPARVPPCFSHYENAWIARPLGCHNGFRTRRGAGLRACSGGRWGGARRGGHDGKQKAKLKKLKNTAAPVV